MTLRETVQADLAKAKAEVAALEAKLADSSVVKWLETEVDELKTLFTEFGSHLK